MRLMDRALIVAGPPCSLNIWLSSSVRKRSFQNPSGDQENQKVRLSNLIASNMACLLTILRTSGKQFYFVIEQPSSSWLWQLNFMITLLTAVGASTVTTWQAFFGHDMLKPTQLRGTLPNLVKMRRVMTKEARAKYTARFAECSDFSCRMDMMDRESE
ncbi:RHM1 [Symbiodinium pilosum]|uniref:RHM1 protein n=1 Tax=Symbiodinium pilosum TaxID=2952 RepID=A0A812R4D6_SYMPI|nr:RHM1 [Symbiodinium pilosum]